MSCKKNKAECLEAEKCKWIVGKGCRVAAAAEPKLAKLVKAVVKPKKAADPKPRSLGTGATVSKDANQAVYDTIFNFVVAISKAFAVTKLSHANMTINMSSNKKPVGSIEFNHYYPGEKRVLFTRNGVDYYIYDDNPEVFVPSCKTVTINLHDKQVCEVLCTVAQNSKTLKTEVYIGTKDQVYFDKTLPEDCGPEVAAELEKFAKRLILFKNLEFSTHTIQFSDDTYNKKDIKQLDEAVLALRKFNNLKKPKITFTGNPWLTRAEQRVFDKNKEKVDNFIKTKFDLSMFDWYMEPHALFVYKDGSYAIKRKTTNSPEEGVKIMHLPEYGYNMKWHMKYILISLPVATIKKLMTCDELIQHFIDHPNDHFEVNNMGKTVLKNYHYEDKNEFIVKKMGL